MSEEDKEKTEQESPEATVTEPSKETGYDPDITETDPVAEDKEVV